MRRGRTSPAWPGVELAVIDENTTPRQFERELELSEMVHRLNKPPLIGGTHIRRPAAIPQSDGFLDSDPFVTLIQVRNVGRSTFS